LDRDYRENIGERRITPNDPPGNSSETIGHGSPETGVALGEKIFADIERIIVPGVVALALPQS